MPFVLFYRLATGVLSNYDAVCVVVKRAKINCHFTFTCLPIDVVMQFRHTNFNAPSLFQIKFTIRLKYKFPLGVAITRSAL